jgi:hypothetical protein
MLDHLDVEAAADEQCREVVPEVMEPESIGTASTLRLAARIAHSMAQVDDLLPRPVDVQSPPEQSRPSSRTEPG